MNTIEIYTLPTCPYCIKAKELLKDNYLDFNEYDISHDEENMRKELSDTFDLQGIATVPQIIINGQHIGGYTELQKIVSNGQLNKYLHN